MVEISGSLDVRAEPMPVALNIQTVKSGTYKGFNLAVAVSAKFVVVLLVALLILFPEGSAETLSWLKTLTLSSFASWYNMLLSVLVAFVLVIICLPVSGRLTLGPDGARPDHGTASWLAMMLCAGIGCGILVYSVSEPISHFTNNPEIISGAVTAHSHEAAVSSLKYVYLHWGISAWASYALIGLTLGLACHRYGQPLTMRSGLAPLFGKRLEGASGNLIDTISILAIISGITTTIALGLEQICSGISAITGNDFFADNAGNATLVGLLTALVAAISVAITSVISGVDRGVKWVSQIGVVLALGILALFVFSGAGMRIFGLMFESTIGYIQLLPEQATLYDPSTSTKVASLRDWQNDWTIFYWAWWIAFAPFVGLFLTKISRGRTVREFLIGAIIAPTSMCFVWFAGTGGSALFLELDGIAGGSVLSADHAFRIFEAMEYMLSPRIAVVLKAVLVLLFLLLIVASTTAAIMAIKAIGSAGNDKADAPLHSVIWACVIAAFAAAVLVIGGVHAVRDMMIITALPFSVVMALKMCAASWMIYNSEGATRTKAQLYEDRPENVRNCANPARFEHLR